MSIHLQPITREFINNVRRNVGLIAGETNCQGGTNRMSAELQRRKTVQASFTSRSPGSFQLTQELKGS
jgi:hypothetical protein